MALDLIKPAGGLLFLAFAVCIWLSGLATSARAQEKITPPAEKQAEAESKPSDSTKRVELNLLG